MSDQTTEPQQPKPEKPEDRIPALDVLVTESALRPGEMVLRIADGVVLNHDNLATVGFRVGDRARLVLITSSEPCPRCGTPRAPLALLCARCWQECPRKLRRKWFWTLSGIVNHRPEARAILAWARPPEAQLPATNGRDVAPAAPKGDGAEGLTGASLILATLRTMIRSDPEARKEKARALRTEALRAEAITILEGCIDAFHE